MSRRLLAAALLGVGATAAARAAGADPARASQTSPVGATGVLAGQTVDAVTGAPVANTLIGLSQRVGPGPNTQPSLVSVPLVLVLTDGQGRFVVRDVPKGSFLLLATAPGYIVSNYGQGRPGGPTRTIDLVGGEVITNLTIPLWRHAAISGTVTDEAGEPVVGTTVRVLRRAGNGPGGEARFAPGAQATTDDRGEYRITALTPGQFLVAVPQTEVTVPARVVDAFLQTAAGRGGRGVLDVMSSGSAVPSAGGGVRLGDWLLQSSGGGRIGTTPPPAPGGRVLVYPTALYGAGDSTSPTPLTLASGEERSGIDFHLAPLPAVRVSGTATAGGQPAANVGVRLVRAGGPAIQNQADFEAAATVTSADGTFTLLGVPAGRYVLKMLRTPRATLAPALAANPAIVSAYGGGGAATGSDPPLVGAQLPITVGDRDLLNVAVILTPGGTVSGQVVFAPGSATPTPKQLQSVGVLLSSEDGGLPGSGIQIARLGASGTFTQTAPSPGRFLVTALGVPQPWRLTGIVAGGQPLAGPIDLGHGDVPDVALTFTDQVAQIAGTIRTSSGAPKARADIVLFSTDRKIWVQEPLNPRQPRIEQASNTGEFSVLGILPGEYLVAAVDDADVPEVVDATFLEAVAKFATRLTLAANERATHDLTIGRIK